MGILNSGLLGKLNGSKTITGIAAWVLVPLLQKWGVLSMEPATMETVMRVIEGWVFVGAAHKLDKAAK